MSSRVLPWWRCKPCGYPSAPAESAGDAERQWWTEAVIYQLAPWTFYEAGNSGCGNLRGIIERLEYLSALAVDALWLMPIYPSRGCDCGYDPENLTDVAPGLGSMEDFRELLDAAHALGLRVILDMVWNHTADTHPWFVESRSSRSNLKADWYVWADPSADGGPPNNWCSVFDGASGWHYDRGRGQYYWSNFFPCQPDLNWHHPEVRRAVLSNARYWLDLGIDGMRLDAVNFYVHDQHLTDNPACGPGGPVPDGIAPEHPATRQRLVNSFNRPEACDDYIRPLRDLSECYPGTVLLGEVTLCEDSVQSAAAFTRGRQRLHLAYHSALLFDDRLDQQRMSRIVDHVLESFDDSGSCWIVGNHDYRRLRSRWGGNEAYPEAFWHMVAALLIALPGALCLWQGDELGLPEACIPGDIPEDRLRDPLARQAGAGRDGARTPMPWDDTLPLCGFSSGEEAWLPIPRSHHRLSVARQRSDPDSMLSCWRRLLHWRRLQPALCGARCQRINADPPWLLLLRCCHQQRLLCVFNLGAELAELDMQRWPGWQEIDTLGFTVQISEDRGSVGVPGWGCLFADLPCDQA